MKIKNFIYLFIFFPLLVNAQRSINIIPQPVNIDISSGNFTITENTTIQFKKRETELKKAATFLSESIKSISGYNLPLNKKNSHAIHLILAKIDNIGDEGYKIEVTPNIINIQANTKIGIIYGIQSLLQLLPPVRTNAALNVPCLNIEDYPRLKWRGMHLDVCRHFFSPKVIKEYLDLMASYKLNVFHWHLVDDQGWRIEIKQYPKLTNIGAWRVDNTHLPWNVRPQARKGEAPTYGGYYTQKQIKDIIAYAAERNITIVPEIEMPGHVASAISAYPELSCNKEPQLPLTGGDYSNISSNYCAGNDSVFIFLKNVLTEVVNLFPSEYIHIGGDEVNKESWKHCKLCQQRIKEENLKDEKELQSYFIKRIEKFLISKNRKMIGWDEILEGGLAPEATVMSWRGETGGIKAAKMGHNVIMTPGTPCYFDHYQAGPAGEPLAIGGFNSLKKVYNYDPIPKELSKEEAKYILGAQANVWTEYITTTEHLEYMILPRMAALAEVVWTPKEEKEWHNFNLRLKNEFRKYEQKGLRYCPGNFTVDIKPLLKNGKLFITLSTEIFNNKIVYTLDGSIPTLASNYYSKPIELKSSTHLKAFAVVDGQIKGTVPSEQQFVMHEAIGKNINYKFPVSPYYQADGSNTLTDGVRGTFSTGNYWHGFIGNDVIATIDLGDEQNISSIALGCLQKYKDWIFMPKQVTFETSLNGKNYEIIETIKNPISQYTQEAIIDFKTTLKNKKVRYIRISAKKDVCPPRHNGEGKPAWIFVDEIIVK